MIRIEKSAVLAAVLAGAAFVLSAEDVVWTPDGLDGVPIHSLAAGPLGERYAGTEFGIFRSTEAGVWTLLLDSPHSVSALAIDPGNPDVVFAGADRGVNKSTDGGQHFRRPTSSPIGVRALAIDPVQPETIYVGGQSGISRTTDGGETWSERLSGSIVERIAALVVDPTRPGTVYAGADRGDSYSYYYYDPPEKLVLRSSDSGDRWLPILRTSDDVLRDGAGRRRPQRGALIAATWDHESEAGSVLRNTDAGLTWKRSTLGRDIYVTALLADPNVADRVYAATAGYGVLQSVDGGATWSSLAAGLPPDRVSSLAFDPSDGMLRAGTDRGVFAIRIAAPRPVCAPGAGVLCLLGGRYRVEVTAENPRTGQSAAGLAIPGGDRFGSFSLPAFTGDPTLPEVFVKVVEPEGALWVFYGGLTSLPYTLTVTETVTGRTATYGNPPENRFCGGVDGNAFPDDGVDPCFGCWDYVRSASTAEESADGALSLLEGRFSVTLSAYSSYHNRTEPGVAVAKTDRYGYFTLPGFTGDATFPEVHVKMVDFRAVSGSFLLFHTGLTSLDYTLTVTDEVTGEVRTFQSAEDYCGAAVVLASGELRIRRLVMLGPSKALERHAHRPPSVRKMLRKRCDSGPRRVESSRSR